MINISFKSVLELINAYNSEDICIRQLEDLRWEGNPVSPFDETSIVYKCSNNKYKCKNTGKYFNVKTGTLFDSTKIPLQKWFLAIFLITEHKRGISSVQLARDLGVTQKTSWHMLQRIRECFGQDDDMLSGEVQVDETFVGGKNKNRHADKKVANSQGRSFKDKTPVVGLLEPKEEESNVRLHKVIPNRYITEKKITKPAKLYCEVVGSTSAKEIQPIIRNKVCADTILVTDEWCAYHGLGADFNHKFVDHGRKNYQTEDGYSSNGVENAWSHLKRTLHGTYIHVTRKHLFRYVNEFVFRFNNMGKKMHERFYFFFANMENRLTYKQLVK